MDLHPAQPTASAQHALDVQTERLPLLEEAPPSTTLVELCTECNASLAGKLFVGCMSGLGGALCSAKTSGAIAGGASLAAVGFISFCLGTYRSASTTSPGPLRLVNVVGSTLCYGVATSLCVSLAFINCQDV